MDTSRTLISRKTQRDQVCDRLRAMIVTGGAAIGDRLPSIAELAERFGTSPRTVHLALREISAQGYVTLKHGAGTFVVSRQRPLALTDTVAICMAAGAHLFGELTSLLVNALNERHIVPLVLDMASNRFPELLQRILHTDAGCFMVHPAPGSRAFDIILKQHKPVISFFDYGSPLDEGDPRYLIATDYDLGGRLVARHLWTRGHRRVLLLGSESARDLWTSPEGKSVMPGTAFIEEWTTLGGLWETQETLRDTGTPAGYRLPEEAFARAVSGDPAVTAIFGVRDVDAWVAQQAIRVLLPHLQDRIECVGYYDTPWSRAGNPPFSTVSTNLPDMVDAAIQILDALRSGQTPANRTVVISPTLVARGEGL